MQNLMIFDNNISNIKKIINNVSKSVNNVNIYNISTNKNEVVKLIKTKEVDTLLINLEIIGKEILKFLDDNMNDFYEKSIILFYNDSKYMNTLTRNIINNKYIFECINLSNGLDHLVDLLQKLTFIKENMSKENIIKNRIKRELRKLNYNFNHVGTHYIIESVFIIHINEFYNVNLNKKIYPILAKKYNKPINTIKGDITQATKIMYYECNEKILKNYFGYLDSISKPTVKEVITTINDKI